MPEVDREEALHHAAHDVRQHIRDMDTNEDGDSPAAIILTQWSLEQHADL